MMQRRRGLIPACSRKSTLRSARRSCRGTLQVSGHVSQPLCKALSSRVIGATAWEAKPGYTQGPHHFHHEVEDWAYVVSGEPVQCDRSDERALGPGSLVAFQAGPDGAHIFAGLGQVVKFSVGARQLARRSRARTWTPTRLWQPGVQFRPMASLETWTEPADDDTYVLRVPGQTGYRSRLRGQPLRRPAGRWQRLADRVATGLMTLVARRLPRSREFSSHECDARSHASSKSARLEVRLMP